jgi:anthranilate phosphoribosyltransferase
VHPADFQLPKAAPEALRGGDAAENAVIAQRVLSGERGAPRDIVLLNAAVSLLIAGTVATVPEGVERAAAAIDSGAAAGVLERLVAVSNAGSSGS